MKVKIPVDEDLADRLMAFWARIFGESGDLDRSFLLGDEAEWNEATLYVEEKEGRPISTCMTVRSRSQPGLSGFAEVATDLDYRGRGLASKLCRQAVDDFWATGGEALFLGTGNSAAVRIYDRLGWRKLAGANVMVNIRGDGSPEEFLVDYFRTPGEVAIEPAGPDARVPMIPLIWTPHDHQVLDANVHLFSRRYVLQPSCMGLHPRYSRTLEGCGKWFVARTEDGRVVGLSSAKMDDGEGRVDAFVHRRYRHTWDQLIRVAIDWCRERSLSPVAVVSVEDERKRGLFEALGFHPDVRTHEPFDVSGRMVEAVGLSHSQEQENL